jgi:hypothetical protein
MNPQAGRFASLSLIALLGAVALCRSPSLRADPPGWGSGACIDIRQMSKNKVSPPELYSAVASCIKQRDYDRAAAFFALAGIDIRFDAARVTEPSARAAGGALLTLSLQGFSDVQQNHVRRAVQALTASPRRDAFCAQVRRMGYPVYFPDYMIDHALAPADVDDNFDPEATWTSLRLNYLKCVERP